MGRGFRGVKGEGGEMLVKVAILKNADILVLQDPCNRPWEMSACNIVM